MGECYHPPMALPDEQTPARTGPHHRRHAARLQIAGARHARTASERRPGARNAVQLAAARGGGQARSRSVRRFRRAGLRGGIARRGRGGPARARSGCSRKACATAHGASRRTPCRVEYARCADLAGAGAGRALRPGVPGPAVRRPICGPPRRARWRPGWPTRRGSTWKSPAAPPSSRQRAGPCTGKGRPATSGTCFTARKADSGAVTLCNQLPGAGVVQA